jgi:hypothetical protein
MQFVCHNSQRGGTAEQPRSLGITSTRRPALPRGYSVDSHGAALSESRSAPTLPVLLDEVRVD